MSLFFPSTVPFRAGLWALSFGVVACSAPPRHPPATSRLTHQEPNPASPVELSQDDLRLATTLERHVEALRRHGPRDGDHPWELLETVEYITRTLEESGLPVERATLERGGVIFHAFSVMTHSANPSAPTWIVAASYDSLSPRLASPSIDSWSHHDAGALETASWLELVRLMGGAHFERGVRFVLAARPEGEGDDALFREAAGKNESSGVLYLGAMGGSGLALAASGADPGLLPILRAELAGSLHRPRVQTHALAPGAVLSFLAQADPERAKFPQILVGSGDSEEGYALAAVRLHAVRRALAEFLGERPTNDEMVTPLYSGLR